jgi:broad specificity phosphatase PhoE
LKIILMRHGKPNIDNSLRLNALAFGVWVEQYNAAGLDADDLPPREAVEQAGLASFIVCSDLPRSLESARRLGIKRIDLSSFSFREFDMPSSTWRFPVLPLSLWLLFFRLAWMFGYSPHVESFKSAKARVHHCAEQLVNLASIHDTVLFVGHGWLNWLLVKYLKRLGWRLAKKPKGRYWRHCVLEKSAIQAAIH